MSDFRWSPKRILVGFEGSEGGKDAVDLARVLSDAGSEILLVNVIPYPGPMPASFYVLGYQDATVEKDFFDEARAVLGDRVVEVRSYVGGSPAHALSDIVEGEGFDLVLVGSPHRGAVGRAVLGSVAQGLMHGTPAPVIVAPRGFAQQNHDAPRVIAVAYDGMPESNAALRHAEALARAGGASLRVLTVASVPTTVAGLLGYVPPMPKAPADVLRDGVASVDDEAAAEGRELHGDSIAGALAEACGEDVDLLVAGSRGYGAFSRVMIGSVSTALIHTAPCPVLIVPRPDLKAR
ncbi:MAG TPA: universal stress protein [Solirubrobacterales bacterium]|nr:universal stress protein [Solirubrobacterales bacterium]